MGIGDEIMATARARRLHESNGYPVCVVGRNGAPRWSPVWENNPRIVKTRERRCNVLASGGGAGRPYIAAKTSRAWRWKHWEREPGEIYLSDQELQFAEPYAGFILVEPHTKFAWSNKAWPIERWAALVRGDESRYIQVGPLGTTALPGVRLVETTFREACAVLARSLAFVGTEGALHHAAAALGVPAVVLWSEFISPEFTGYDSQTNIRHAGPACGARISCRGCAASMLAIEVAEVAAAIKAKL